MSNTKEISLRPANENPWYCLATLHGEQPINRVDRDLADKNVIAWDRWTSGSVTEGIA